AEDGIRDRNVTGVQTCALPIYRNIVPAVTFNFCQLFFSFISEYDTVAAVYFRYDLFNFPVDRKVILVKGGEVLLLLKNFQHLFRKIGSTSAAVLPNFSKRDTH